MTLARTTPLHIALLLVMLVTILSVSQIRPELENTRLEVRGYLLIDTASGHQYLCEELLESWPPQCGGMRLALDGFDWRGYPGLRREGSVIWSGEKLIFRGVLNGGTLRSVDGD
jgi:hypothetical protein